jgi:hypothetical protein
MTDVLTISVNGWVFGAILVAVLAWKITPALGNRSSSTDSGIPGSRSKELPRRKRRPPSSRQ